MMSFRTIAFAGVSLLTLATPALAQSQPADDSDSGKKKDEIVVTGTLIRGIAPASSQSLAITAEAAKATGASTTAQLLATMPQSGFFATMPVVLGNNNYQKSANRPTLRNLDGGNNGSNPTLLLVNGHRLPGMGVLSNSPDLDAIASGAIQRVEVVPDGGSSIYGADAVGGVINLITRRDFDGVDINARYGFAKDYYTIDANATVGKAWDGGSAFLSYNFAKHDSIFGRDRAFVQRRDWVNNVLQDTNCTPANISIAGKLYASATSAAGLGNRCDRSDDQTFFPAERRHSVFGNLTIDSGGSLSFSMDGFYTQRVNNGLGQPFVGSMTLASTNPFYQAVTALAPTTPNEAVLFSFGSVIPATQYAELNTWGITPSIKYKLGENWQVNALFNYGEGRTEVTNQAINTSLFSGLATAGTFNPFNVGAAGNATALASLRDFFVYGKSINKLTNGRVVVDGALFPLPAGDVKVAIGAEFSHEEFSLKFTPTAGLTTAGIAAAAFPKASRNVQSVFGELSVPLINNDDSGIHLLNLSLSGRYDHYSDAGNTFNPKIGIVFEPVKGFKLRGNWSRSFQSPGLSDTTFVQPPSVTDFLLLAGGVRFPNPAVAPVAGQTQLTIGGGGPALRPQKAQSWSFGIDLNPEPLPGLSISLTYYNVTFKDRIAIPSIFASDFYSAYPAGTPATGGFYIQNPTNQQIIDFGALGGTTGPASVAAYSGSNFVAGKVYNLLFAGKANLATVKTSGLDYSVSYTTSTSFGSVFANSSGELVLARDEQATALSAPISRNGTDFPVFRASATLGATIGNFLTQATLVHSASYNVAPLASALNQSVIGAFNSVNLFMKYDFKGSGMTKDLSITLNIDNAFDTAPPLYQGTFSQNSDGYGIGTPIGRLITLGLSKKF